MMINDLSSSVFITLQYLYEYLSIENIQRRLPNNLNKNVHLFYRAESEKWCLGPEPNGTYCWIYCDSKSKWPWLKTLRPFWHEHTGGNEWVNIPIIIESAKKSTVNEENSK